LTIICDLLCHIRLSLLSGAGQICLAAIILASVARLVFRFSPDYLWAISRPLERAFVFLASAP
jgi:hypothetical protein